MRNSELIRGALSGVRDAIRALGRRDHLLVMAASVFAIAVGLCAASLDVFAEVYSGSPAGVHQPERVVVLPSVGNYPDFKSASASLTSLIPAAYSNSRSLIFSGERVEDVRVQCVTSRFFEVLKPRPSVGRLLTADSVDGVVLSRRLTEKLFGGVANPVGSSVRIGRYPTTVVGIVQRDFAGVSAYRPDLWISMDSMPDVCGRGSNLLDSTTAWWLYTIGLLNPGVSVDRVQAELEQWRPTERDTPDQAISRVATVGEEYRRRLQRWNRVVVLLEYASVVVLVLACSNLAVLFGLRAASRRRELAIRHQLGATRWNLGMMLVAEALAIALSCCVVAWVVALAVESGIKSFYDLGPTSQVGFRRLALVVGLACFGGVVSGLGPALAAMSRLKAMAIGRSPQTVAGRLRVHRGLLVIQVGASLCALVLGGAIAQGLSRLEREPGFDIDSVFAVTLDPQRVSFRTDDGLQEIRARLQDELNHRLGRKDAALTSYPPLDYEAPRQFVIVRSTTNGRGQLVSVNFISPNYFDVVGTILRIGRPFAMTDAASSPAVAVIDATTAHSLWPSDVVGKCAYLQGTGACVEIVGVTPTRRVQDLGREISEVFLPATQYRLYNLAHPGRTLLIRSGEQARREVRILADRAQLFQETATVRELADRQTVKWRFSRAAFGMFGAILVGLVVCGVYSSLSFILLRRRSEFALRIALGATASRLVARIAWLGGTVVVVGLALGLLLSYWAVSYASGFFGQIDGMDWRSCLALCGVILLTAAIAIIIPAARVLSISPARLMSGE